MKILLVDDDKVTSPFIIKGLNQAGYTTEYSPDGANGLFRAVTEKYDIIIVDIMLPRLDGFSLIEELRKKGITTPIIVLSAKSSVEDRVKGLHKGGDDYLVKPFSFTELLARMQALLRRSNSIAEPTTLRIGDLSVDILTHKVYRGEIQIDIQPLDYALLEYLIRNKGRVVSKTMIMENVWEHNFDPSTNVIEVRVCRLRDKIDKPFKTQLLHTIRGFGYVLEERN